MLSIQVSDNSGLIHTDDLEALLEKNSEILYEKDIIQMLQDSGDYKSRFGFDKLLGIGIKILGKVLVVSSRRVNDVFLSELL